MARFDNPDQLGRQDIDRVDRRGVFNFSEQRR